MNTNPPPRTPDEVTYHRLMHLAELIGADFFKQSFGSPKTRYLRYISLKDDFLQEARLKLWEMILDEPNGMPHEEWRNYIAQSIWNRLRDIRKMMQRRHRREFLLDTDEYDVEELVPEDTSHVIDALNVMKVQYPVLHCYLAAVFYQGNTTARV